MQRAAVHPLGRRPSHRQIIRRRPEHHDVGSGDLAAVDLLEWTSVFVLNTVDGCLPSDLATGSTPEIEEERRLLYVAMTRAKDQLHLMVPQRFFTHGQRSAGDRHVYAQRTRFIPGPILEHFETCSWPPAKSIGSSAGRLTGNHVDVREKMRRMWG